ncbi:TRAP transporter large permease subunit [Hoeflea sp. G2-23]|uniref:TRAP transporter large permease subunit n=1 Tax=Hoeflea algicola TaxID=2983763 RepID=A0ABT3Z4Y7_9HYPH|nr:TRAP transporter large permease subunit [Hoeflea algicola]MCY0146825.1 TRAP transporter large permease subunit [Hoeflea algicola]
MLTIVYCLFAFSVAYLRPDVAPRPEFGNADANNREVFISALKGFVAPIILIVAVLGSIFGGWATPTEAAAVGAAGAFLLALVRNRMDVNIFSQAIRDAGIMTTIVFSILIGATAFSYVFRSLGGEWLVSDFVNFMGLGPWGILYLIMFIVFIFGFFFDWLEITLIVLPIFSPLIVSSDFGIEYFGRNDVLLWFAILVAVNLQTSFLSPPFGYTLFYMKGAVQKEIGILTIYKGVIPYIILQLLVLFSIMAFPFLVTWLPNSILG